jgi:hypothetical protein
MGRRRRRRAGRRRRRGGLQERGRFRLQGDKLNPAVFARPVDSVPYPLPPHKTGDDRDTCMAE